MSYAYAKAYCILWQPYLWTDVSTAVRLPQICDLVYLVSIVSQWPIDMRQNVRDQESQVSMAWPRVVIRDLKQGRRRRR